MIKIAFFDVDGTLLSFETHTMPESTRRALDIMRSSGIKLVVASGRSEHELPPELRTGYDAYVMNNGQRCTSGGTMYRSVSIDQADVEAIVGQVDQGLYDVAALMGDRSFVNRHSPQVVAASERMNIRYPEGDLHLALERPVYQFLMFAGLEEERMLLDATSHVVTTRWTDLFCDVVPAQGGKGYGVEATLEHFGFTPDEAVAFGDGENDLSMLQAVGTGVAMGNAWDVVKADADYITDDVDSDGVWNACRHLGLV